ncbi:hypothetical protein OJF2_61790 [Aquisphaera giovannonii]|uniref:Uncharacterized protein n=1 Tax=Aquisphaera giovannonii TaxID=406548 RepID=A0A5B9WAC9_9BACT|nr:hypothetical protein [Aquisphaera giovannonii]QEH37588.1 hypothetical protein OJF2_61790 [Aquisphaera giovannonii]
MPDASPVAFVTVVESPAAMQSQVLLLAESLRRWGGGLADAPITCVSPRFQFPLRQSTLRRFEHLNSTYAHTNIHGPHGW